VDLPSSEYYVLVHSNKRENVTLVGVIETVNLIRSYALSNITRVNYSTLCK